MSISIIADKKYITQTIHNRCTGGHYDKKDRTIQYVCIDWFWRISIVFQTSAVQWAPMFVLKYTKSFIYLAKGITNANYGFTQVE